jgi:hypothetical protein
MKLAFPRPRLQPSAMKVKSALRGSADLSAGTETAPTWFWPISRRLGFQHAHPVKRAAAQRHAHEAAVVIGGRGKPAAADVLRW